MDCYRFLIRKHPLWPRKPKNEIIVMGRFTRLVSYFRGVFRTEVSWDLVGENGWMDGWMEVSHQRSENE